MPANETAGSTSAGLRVGDAERHAAATALQDHYSQGRLTWTELDERLGSAYAARTRGELDVLFSDLPAQPAVSLEKPSVTGDAAHRVRERQLLLFAACLAVVVSATILIVTGVHGFFVLPLIFFLIARRAVRPCTGVERRPRLGNPYAPGGDRHFEVQHLRHRHAPRSRSDD